MNDVRLASAAPDEAGAGLWRRPLRAALHGRPLPLVWTPEGLVPAASLWSGARQWVAWMRAAGLVPGDRLVCALPPGATFVMVLVASLWEELTFVPVPATADRAAIARELAPRVVVAQRQGSDAVCPDAAGAPPTGAVLAPADAPPTPDARLLLRTSGTGGTPRWIALSDANVWAVLESHRPQLRLDGAVVLSVLPWHHAFGLVLELLPSLLAGAELLRDPSGGRDAASMLAVATSHPVTHLHAVPRTIALLAEHASGRALLASLAGGVVGGAAVDAALVRALSGTRLRVGYGQTEAAPGIALGESGEWRPGHLGRPVGCELRRDADGVLAFRGANAHLGEWRDGALVRRVPADGWVRTGDLARIAADGSYTFEGRLADAFKLANGRFVAAAAIEQAVRARFPSVREALLSSPDGDSLVLALTAPAGDVPSADAVAPLLGPLAARPLRVVPVPAGAWERTPKGELDRRFPTGRPSGASDPPAP
ncbi:MAG TPA: class I adenylate-forming enzyme family protein [Gemmatirosa sp.]|nr:class I adenylate-forming enzyme family protein [Gemmatirosa sp.]